MIKKLNPFIPILCIICFVFPVRAQDDANSKKTRNFKIGIEFGADLLSGEAVKLDRVRENRSYYHTYNDYDYYCGLVGGNRDMGIVYVGVKPEIFFHNNRLGISSGLRFSEYTSSLISDRDYFLWLLNEDEKNTEYIRIKEIKQRSRYIGIPLEFRIFPNRRELPFQHYFKIGTVFNYRFHSENKIEFQNRQMNQYEELVGNQINDSVNRFSASLFGALGFKIGGFDVGGGKKCPYINIEFHFPKVMLNSKSSSFIATDVGGGIQFSTQIPLGKTVPIGSR